MNVPQITRRKFLTAATLAGAGLAVGPLPSLAAWQVSSVPKPERIVPTICGACGNHCGLLVHVKAGRPWRVTGNPDHDISRGKVCARGQAHVLDIYNPDRLTQPLKRTADGKYEPIPWEQAYQEIAAKLQAILAASGPGAVFWADHPKSVKWYTDRFMDAIGSPNKISHPTTCHTGRTVGFNMTLGTVPNSDFDDSQYIVLIGRNPAEGINPSMLSGITAAREKGARLVVVDPRMNNTAMLADDWLAIRAGTDLALVLAWAHVLIAENLYDADFVNKNGVGFEQLAQVVKQYTPEWAEPITGIKADTIRRIAREMGKVRPRAFIDPSWYGAFGCHYANSTQTARAVAIVNALLGNINRRGGLVLPKGVKLGSLDAAKHPEPPKPKLARADGAGVPGGRFPLALGNFGIPQMIPELVEQGVYKAGFVYHHNPARAITDPTRMAEALRKLELLVVIDIFPSETAMLAHYVLPETMYVEMDDLIRTFPGKRPQVLIRQRVVPPVADVRPGSEIVTELAQAVGIGQYFNFTEEDVNRAWLKPLGITLEEMKQKGVLDGPEPWQEGLPAAGIGTPSKKVEFFSKRFESAGFDAVPAWIPPQTAVPAGDPGAFRMLRGHQAIHTHNTTAVNPHLMGITHRYGLERIWINAGRAEALGIADGDWVVVENEMASGTVRAHVTEAIHPESIFMPTAYGCASPAQRVANGVGISPNVFTPIAMEAISAHAMMAEVVVKVRKADAAERSAAEERAAEALDRWKAAVKAGRRA